MGIARTVPDKESTDRKCLMLEICLMELYTFTKLISKVNQTKKKTCCITTSISERGNFNLKKKLRNEEKETVFLKSET